MGNMYQDSKKQWNIFVGCEFDCIYCKKSFQAQMKRQKNNCIKCYNYTPHFHPKRLEKKILESLPLTFNDEFIWCCSSGDIFFAEENWINQIIESIRNPICTNRTFFFQTKNPICFNKYSFPENSILGITLETNRDKDYESISKAPIPSERIINFYNIKHKRKFITIEPILDFDLWSFVDIIRNLNPERVYIGYDTKKNNLPEPDPNKVKKLCKELDKFTNVKTKFIKVDKNG